MGAPYSSQTVTNYNSNPPPDDGSQTEANRVKWATIKTKLSDPLNTFASAINTAISTAFGKIIGGGGVTSSAISYQISSSDQGKLIRATAASITLTTPDATDVDDPFVCAILNNSSGSITIDGSGAQTVDGLDTVTLPAGSGCFLFTDGSNWYTSGLPGVLAGNQMAYGMVINGTIAESNAGNAVTFSLKTLAGNDPSANDQVLIAFRNASAGTGNYVYRSVTSALSLTLSAGSTLGTANSTPCKLWLVLFDDGGTIRLGAINCLSGVNIYQLGQVPLASSTAEGGAGGADSAHVFYTTAAVTSKAYIPIAYASYESGLSTAGNWNVSPTRIQLFGAGVKLPGDVVQTRRTQTGTIATGSTAIVADNTVPQNTEGDQYMSQAITPTSAANILRIVARAQLSHSASGGVSTIIGIGLFQDSSADALTFGGQSHTSANLNTHHIIDHLMRAGTTNETTMKIRGGAATSGTTTFNGQGGGQLFGGVYNSFLHIEELAA